MVELVFPKAFLRIRMPLHRLHLHLICLPRLDLRRYYFLHFSFLRLLFSMPPIQLLYLTILLFSFRLFPEQLFALLLPRLSSLLLLQATFLFINWSSSNIRRLWLMPTLLLQVLALPIHQLLPGTRQLWPVLAPPLRLLTSLDLLRFLSTLRLSFMLWLRLSFSLVLEPSPKLSLFEYVIEQLLLQPFPWLHTLLPFTFPIRLLYLFQF